MKLTNNEKKTLKGLLLQLFIYGAGALIIYFSYKHEFYLATSVLIIESIIIRFIYGKRFVKGVFSKQSHSSPWKQHITGFPRGIFRKFHNLYLSANPSIYGYVISLPFIFAYSAKLLRAFAKPTISDSFNVQITDSHSLIHFFVCFICSSEI